RPQRRHPGLQLRQEVTRRKAQGSGAGVRLGSDSGQTRVRLGPDWGQAGVGGRLPSDAELGRRGWRPCAHPDQARTASTPSVTPVEVELKLSLTPVEVESDPSLTPSLTPVNESRRWSGLQAPSGFLNHLPSAIYHRE